MKQKTKKTEQVPIPEPVLHVEQYKLMHTTMHGDHVTLELKDTNTKAILKTLNELRIHE